MPNGIVVIDKPALWTSMDVCAKIRGILHEKRVGHGGTLDPMATGVLPVFVGTATRAAEFCENGVKEYEAAFRLGVVTDTQDVTGTVLETHGAIPPREEIERALAGFRGTILQTPPMYSAIKVNGKRLYDLARRGQEVERASREVTIYDLVLLDQTGEAEYTLRCRCSKGTYIRTLCHDLGQALGCGAALSALRRTAAGGCTIAQAVTLADVEAQGEAILRPTETLFSAYPVYVIPTAGKEKRVRNGNPITDERLADGVYRVHAADGSFLCLSRAERGTLTMLKNFMGA